MHLDTWESTQVFTYVTFSIFLTLCVPHSKYTSYKYVKVHRVPCTYIFPYIWIWITPFSYFLCLIWICVFSISPLLCGVKTLSYVLHTSTVPRFSSLWWAFYCWTFIFFFSDFTPTYKQISIYVFKSIFVSDCTLLQR